MKTGCMLLIFALVSGGIAFAQGPLTPPLGANAEVGPVNVLSPGGAPQATMKTLHQVEPRIPIASLPFSITESGSYYFTGNLTFAVGTGHAIQVAASDVTIDLMGFTLDSESAVTGSGIHLGSGIRNVTVRNGTIGGTSSVLVQETSPEVADWLVGATGGFTSGVGFAENLSPPRIGHLQDLVVRGCRGFGCLVPDESIVERCRAMDNVGGGFVARFSSFRDCNASQNMGVGGFYSPLAGCKYLGCTANFNSPWGFGTYSATFSHCTALTNKSGFEAANSTLSHCTASGNQEYGIRASSGTVSHCSTELNKFDGIIVEKGTVTGCTARRNKWAGIAAFGGQVSDSTAVENERDGIFAPYARVTGCKVSDNHRWGIYADHAVIIECHATTNNTLNNPLNGGIYCDDSVVSHCFSKNNFVIQYQIGSGATADANR